ncbi:sugar phosphate isomerase/epimerase [Alicyclobacillus sp. SO9]|uniref:sugar phosphate isomerase/epimerase family protein n=1 Tax=Alicyclobacillus sp. SO9 TaxID=2665646 RepID=UPI0018E7B592|nr:sugar phosphate isomerase/epimerase family protein [Alicyclobacillus sp. SO9]QQE80558.1 sugar phosphate isomerase/epimerase [Alicyclobacillus sp. SO9]
MKKGVNQFSMPEHWSLTTIFEMVKNAGFDGIELNLGDSGELSLTSSDSHIESAAREAEAVGVDLPSVATALFWKYSLTHNEAGIRDKAYGIAKRLIDVAVMMKVSTVLIVPGLVDADTPYDKAYERAVEQLQSIGEYARQQNVQVAVENVWNRFLLSPLEMQRFLRDIDNPFVGVYFDVGNVLAYGFPEHWIDILGNKIFAVHVKDFKNDIGNIRGFTTLLHGDVDWHAVITKLKASAYDHYLMAEIPPHKYPERFLQEISTALDFIMEVDN